MGVDTHKALDEAHRVKSLDARRTKHILGEKAQMMGGLAERAAHGWALTGTPEQVRDAARAYKVYYQAAPHEPGDQYYPVDHTASVFLIDREGRFRSTFDFHEDEQVILEKVRLLIAQR